VTPKILESKQIGEDTYRGFLKDTATPNHYGIVEFPHDALVKLGFLKKIVSGAHASEDLEKMGALGRTEGEPVSFYVQVIPIGEKPAARALAVGARLVRDPDGASVTPGNPMRNRRRNHRLLLPNRTRPMAISLNAGSKKRAAVTWTVLSLISTARPNSIQKMTRHIITVLKPDG
jgi:hypothetical protein